jgi:hypothetical protein
LPMVDARQSRTGHSMLCPYGEPTRTLLMFGILLLDREPYFGMRYSFNNSRSRLVCARDTGISDCRLSFIFSM